MFPSCPDTARKYTALFNSVTTGGRLGHDPKEFLTRYRPHPFLAVNNLSQLAIASCCCRRELSMEVSSEYRIFGRRFIWCEAIAKVLEGRVCVLANWHAPNVFGKLRRRYLDCDSGSTIAKHSNSSVLLGREGRILRLFRFMATCYFHAAR